MTPLTILRRETGRRISTLLTQAKLEAERMTYTSADHSAILSDLLDQARECATSYLDLLSRFKAAEMSQAECDGLALRHAAALGKANDSADALHFRRSFRDLPARVQTTSIDLEA